MTEVTGRRFLGAGLQAALGLLCVSTAALGQGGGASPQSVGLPLSGGTGGAGSVVTTQTVTPGVAGGVGSVSPVLQVQGALTGSRPADEPSVLAGPLGLREVVQRGLEYNLGSVSVSQAVQQANGQRRIARSVLLPQLTGDLMTAVQQVNLAAQGLEFDAFQDVDIPDVIGPFNVVDLRARVSQSLFDLTSLNNYRAASATARAAEYSAEDARELVVLAVGGTYLQVQAARARVEAARAQVETADALHRQAVQFESAGLVAQVDVDRSEVQALTRRQQFAVLRNDLAKQKIRLVRMIGLRATDQYELAAPVPFAPMPLPSLDDALQQAAVGRRDLRASEAHLRAAERALAAARAERLPTVSVSADYGAIGRNASEAEATFSVVGRVRMPLWSGGRVSARVSQAEAVVTQRHAERDDLAGQIEADVRRAFLDLEAAGSQVELSRRNVEVTEHLLALTRQRFDAGVGDSVEVTQAQEAVANAAFDYINAGFAHNVGKLALARVLGQAADRWTEFLALPE
jgi:outer membrane protein TolC